MYFIFKSRLHYFIEFIDQFAQWAGSRLVIELAITA